MNWLRYSGRIILTLGVIAIAVWATTNDLVDMPLAQFWLGIVIYLIGAVTAWTLVDYRNEQNQSRLPRRGLLRLARRDRFNATLPPWLYDGGRCRYLDILVKHDTLRDALQPLQAAVLTRESRPRVHLIAGAVGTGRSTMLLRLARLLAENNQLVFVALPGPALEALETVIEAARQRQVYLIIDDLDLRPQAEEWLYEIYRTELPIVIVATVATARAVGVQEGLSALEPAGLLAEAVVHRPQISSNDLSGLARRLQSAGRLKRQGLTIETTGDLLGALRYLQDQEPEQNLWQDLDRDDSLPQHQKVMLALCGAAELAVPECLQAAVFGEKAMGRWVRSNLLSLQHCQALPPHRKVCVDLLRTLDPAREAVRAPLAALVQLSLTLQPLFALRLLYGLAHEETTRELAREQVEGLQAEGQAEWPEAVRRAWRRVLEEFGLASAEAGASDDYPPELLLQTRRAFARQDYEAAVQASRKLGEHRLYEAAAGFNLALALCHLERMAEAEAVLEGQRSGPPGRQYLRGLIAEAKGDWPAALDAYEASRKADEVQLAATRRLAFAYLKSGAPRAAIPLFEAVLSYTPRQADLYGGLAVAHLQAGMAQRAAAQSARAIQAGVEPSVARRAVAKACAEVRAYGRVAAELEACLSYDDTDPEAWRELAVACRWLGRFEREAVCLQRLQAAGPVSADLRLRIARNQRDQGLSAEALETLEPLLAASRPALEALLLASDVVGGISDRARQAALAAQAVEQDEASGWGHYWLAESGGEEELSEQMRDHYRQAVKQLQAQVEGATPRQAAKLWQAIYRSAARLGNEALAGEAGRKARQEVAVCEALGAEVESVVHHRCVPPALFLESLPPGGSGGTAAESAPKTTPAPAEAPSFRKSSSFRAQGRG